ncbi:MAG: YegS/Rv2252/BmrU family lipid kinase, partial [Geminicoccaceae bacterium]
MTDPSPAAVPPRRLLLLANPRARNGAAASDLVAPLAGLGLEVVFVEPDGIEALLATIRTTGRTVDRIAIAGGDGSIAAALPALLDLQKPLAVLPLGTANDLARNLRLPDDQAARLRLVAGGVVRRIDLARVNGRPVLNAVSIGLGAAVATLHTGRAKQLLGVLNYPRVLYAAWRRIHPFGVEITCDGVAHRGRFIHVAVVNGRFHGGGIEPRPTGTITDGLLDLYALRDGPVFRLMQIMAKLKIEGAESDQAFRLQGTRIGIATSRPRRANIDGEPIGRTPLDIEIMPEA